MTSKFLKVSFLFFSIAILSCQTQAPNSANPEKIQSFMGNKGEVKLITLNPGHFHAALVQKYQYDQVDSVVHIFAPDGPELKGHLERIDRYNERNENPTNWNSVLHTSQDYLDQMIQQRQGNVVVISGNNARKTDYIKASIETGLNVLSDKPMAITPQDFVELKSIFHTAKDKGVLLYDIMTERYEITTMTQKELSQISEVFGELQTGSVDDPAITKESVHHFFKYVSGRALIRPPWFFDVRQQGEGMVDVSTHLVDLIFWECFPDQIIDYKNDVEVVQARRWATDMTQTQFEKVTGVAQFPDFLMKDMEADVLRVYANGEFNFIVNDVHAKVSVSWDYEAPEGAGDTHYSIMRGTKSNLVIRQGAEQNYKPALYVEPIDVSQTEKIELALASAMIELGTRYDGLSFEKAEVGWQILIPDPYKIGHEAHFAQVTEKYLRYLVDGKLPTWEVPNMIAKYYVTTKAYEMSRD